MQQPSLLETPEIQCRVHIDLSSQAKILPVMTTTSLHSTTERYISKAAQKVARLRDVLHLPRRDARTILGRALLRAHPRLPPLKGHHTVRTAGHGHQLRER
jgi:hypothetical protein